MSPKTRATLQLLSIPGLGTMSYWNLMDAFGSFEKIWQASHQELSACLNKTLATHITELIRNKHSSIAKAEHIMQWCADHDVQLIDNDHAHYPQQLKEITKGPPILYVRGNTACLAEPQLAIVGSRSCSQSGQNNAFAFAAAVAEAGLTITSGLALGIDTHAHRGALHANEKTIAVTGCGIDRVYPQRNRQLAEEIIANGGAIISEFPLNTPPTAQNFPRRNRIISGLSAGVLVVEAALKSGSLITAKYALEQNREVFAIPGSIHNPQSKGCHALLRQGATLVEEIGDILNELERFVVPNRSVDTVEVTEDINISPPEEAVLNIVEYDVCSLDYLADRSKVETGTLLGVLMSLELKGLVFQQQGGYVRNKSG